MNENKKKEWPPPPRLIITVGVAIGLGLPLMFPDSLDMHPGAVSLFIVGNVAAGGLALLLTEGPWHRAAAGFTLTLAFWMVLYSTLSFVRWRSTIKTIEWLKVRRIENAQFWELRLDTLPKLESPPYRALARAKLEQRISRGNELTDGILEERSEQATEWRNGFLLSLTGSVLCAAGAMRSLRELESRGLHAVLEPELDNRADALVPGVVATGAGKSSRPYLGGVRA